MKLTTFLSMNAIMFIPFSIGMLFIPQFIFGMIDVQLNDDDLPLAQMVGSMLFSFGLICLFARKASYPSQAMSAILIGNFTFHAIDSFLTFYGAFSGTMNNVAFAFSSMHLLFAIGFISFYFKGQKSV